MGLNWRNMGIPSSITCSDVADKNGGDCDGECSNCVINDTKISGKIDPCVLVNAPKGTGEKYMCSECPLFKELNDADSTESMFLGITVGSCDLKGEIVVDALESLPKPGENKTDDDLLQEYLDNVKEDKYDEVKHKLETDESYRRDIINFIKRYQPGDEMAHGMIEECYEEHTPDQMLDFSNRLETILRIHEEAGTFEPEPYDEYYKRQKALWDKDKDRLYANYLENCDHKEEVPLTIDKWEEMLICSIYEDNVLWIYEKPPMPADLYYNECYWRREWLYKAIHWLRTLAKYGCHMGISY